MNKKIIIALLLVAAVMGISSCDLIGGIFAPAYAGEWAYEVTEDGDTVKYTLVLEKEAWEMTISAKVDGVWVDGLAVKGTMVVEDDTLTTTATDAKVAVNGTLPEEWTELTAEEAAYFSMGTSTWVVDGDTLTLSDPDDATDKLVFTAVK